MTEEQLGMWKASLAIELEEMEQHGRRSRHAERIMRELTTDMLKGEIYGLQN